MNRLAKFAVPILIWMIPGTVFALGLGEIHVRSKLNQALDAEIELLYSESSEAEATEVALASAEDFRRVGLDRGNVTVPLQFEIAQDASGRYLIRVTSKQPVGDPFVDFLIEVNWPNGRLLREYVVLLDPPVTSPAEVAAVSAPLPSAEPQPTMQPTRSTPSPAAVPGGGSYAVRKGDTLWEIARDQRPGGGISINQMMMVLYQMNRDAFFQDNINALKAGAVLRLPDLEDAQGVSVAQAIAQVRTQNQAWESYRQTWATRTPTVSEAGLSAEYVRPDSDAGKDAESRLELVPAAADGATARANATELASLRAELARSREDMVSAGQENSELRSRVNELESLVGNLERAITLKDADLADLQNQSELTDAIAALPEPEQAPAAMDSGTDDASAEAFLERELDAAVEVSDDTSPVAGGFEDSADAAMAADQEDASTLDSANPSPGVAAQPQSEPGLVEKLLAAVKNPLVLGGVGGALLLGLGGFLWSRRRTEETAGESLVERMMAAEGSPEEAPGDDLAADRGEDDLLGALEAEPENPQTHLALLRRYYAADQADEFVAAAERMLENIGGDAHPAWMEAKAMGANLAPDHPLFGGVADELEEREAGEDDFDFEMAGGDDHLEDQSPATPEFGDELELDEAKSDDDFSLDFDLDDSDLPNPDASEEAPEEAALPADDDMSLDFDLGSAEKPQDAASELEAAEDGSDLEAAEDDFSLDFDMPAEAEGEADVLPLGDEESSSELDLGLGDETVLVDEAPEEHTEFDLQAVTPTGEEDAAELDLDLNLDSLGESETEEQAVDPEQLIKEAATLAELESSDEDLDLGLDDLNLEDQSLIGDDDAVGTKLDLAKAYIDMGDPEGARGMLEEVLAEGNSEQKEKAEDLLNRLSP